MIVDGQNVLLLSIVWKLLPLFRAIDKLEEEDMQVLLPSVVERISLKPLEKVVGQMAI